MPVTDAFRAFATELFEGLGPVHTKRMFSGLGLYIDDAAAGSSCFSYETKTGTRTLTSYYELPENAFDSPQEALEWARKSLIPAQAAALRRIAKKAKRR